MVDILADGDKTRNDDEFISQVTDLIVYSIPSQMKSDTSGQTALHAAVEQVVADPEPEAEEKAEALETSILTAPFASRQATISKRFETSA